MNRALAPVMPAATALSGTACAVRELVRSPASGAPCVHWRLRIVEFVAPGLELVHEVASPEPVELATRAHPEGPAVRVLLRPEHARIEAVPVLHREGTPGARATARHFGLRGPVRVEEVIIRQDEALEADGVLCDPAAATAAGPFRQVDAPAELVHVTIRVTAALSLRPNLLPWALGTAAALLGTVSATAALVRWQEAKRLLPFTTGPAEVRPGTPLRRLWP